MSTPQFTSPPQNWTPPTDVERALWDAKRSGDLDAYVRVLARNRVYFHMPRKKIHKKKGHPPIYKDEAGKDYLAVYTSGLAPHRDGMVVCSTAFPPGMQKGIGRMGFNLQVNPETPVEARFPWNPEQFASWRKLSAQIPDHKQEPDYTLMTYYSGPFTGPLAYGLACGAPLAVTNHVVWNNVGHFYSSYPEDYQNLKDMWDVHDHESWREQMDFLLLAQNSPPYPEFALQVRNAIIAHYPGQPVDLAMWREVTAINLHERDATDEEFHLVMELIGKILRYESRLRADGVLPADDIVTSAVGYDYGRAVNLARWGVSAWHADQQEAEQAVVRAGELVREAYSSWSDYSSGYILGRMLRFDEETYNEFYIDSLNSHRTLLTDPESPWLNLPFGRR